MATSKRVVVVGANFGGLACAMALPRGLDVTVVDASPHFEFLPNIHELISEVKTPELLRLARERLISRLGHRFLLDSVTRIDAAGRAVHTASGRSLPFDACVVAAGGVNNTYGLPGVERHTRPFKTVADCEAIGRRLRDLASSGKALSVVIVGGGLEGVEALGEILRKYRHLSQLEVHLVEREQQLVPGSPSALGREIEQRCQPHPVHFHKGHGVKSVTKTRVTLTSGQVLRSDMTLWTGGAAPSPLLFQSGLATKKGAWARVNNALQSRVHDNIFVVGDDAQLTDSVSKQAYHALAMGSHAAGNVRRFLAGSRLQDFKPGPEISLISLGDLDTYCVIGKRVIAGRALAPAKELIFQANMARLDPPLRFTPAWDFQARYWRSIHELAIPTLWPPSRLARLADLRKLA